MRIVIVGRRDSKAVIQWSRFVGLALILPLAFGLGTGLIFFLLAGHWSHKAVLCGKEQARQVARQLADE